ncbi:hypothetical protein JW948_00350 [bacterium]|nr:hypothetical protein [bacterium]
MKIDVSTGEFVDKISILAIKLEKITDPGKLKNIRKEYELLLPCMTGIHMTVDSPEFRELKAVNLRLWDIEDRIRIKEADKAFDDEFIHLARSVYVENDKRAAIKREINLKTNSEIVEEKEYQEY